MSEAPVVNPSPPPHRAWLPYLDGWRGVSVLAVLAGHFLPIPGINTGRLGVELFFCLSGRLMAGILFVERFPLPTFIWRRVTRVWPALWVFVAIVAAVFAAPGPLHIRGLDIVGALTFTSNYVTVWTGNAPAFDHLWSLSVEEWAYLFLALLALASRRWNIRPLPLLLIAAAMFASHGVLAMLPASGELLPHWRTDVRLPSILLPCAAALLFRGRRAPPWLPVAAGFLGLLLFLDRVPDPIRYTIGTGLLSIAMATIDVAPAWLRGLLSMPWLRRVGLWSFSLYLWQQPFAKWEHGPALLRLMGAVGAGIASYYLVEQPARKLLNRLADLRQSSARPA